MDEPMVGKIGLSLYLHCNTRHIVKNWRELEFIREKYSFRLGKYIIFHIDRIADIFQIPNNHPTLVKLTAKLYRTI